MNEFNYNQRKQRAINHLNRYYERKESNSYETFLVIGGCILGCIILVMAYILWPGIERFWNSLDVSSKIIIVACGSTASIVLGWWIKDRI